jgi:hypothetical protein
MFLTAIHRPLARACRPAAGIHGRHGHVKPIRELSQAPRVLAQMQ